MNREEIWQRRGELFIGFVCCVALVLYLTGIIGP